MITKSDEAFSHKRAAVNTLSQLAFPEWETYRKYWELCDDVVSGELAVKAKADT